MPEGEPNHPTDDPDGESNTVAILRWAGASVALLLFAAFVVYLVANADAEKTTWNRLMAIYTSLTAIAAAAAGAVFGNHVQKQRAERAEGRADASTDEAARGRALAATLKAEGRGSGGRGLEDALGGESFGPRVSPPDDVAERHAALAHELFPDEGNEG
jgi:hypothetical protein